MYKHILLTGGSGFIGSNFVRFVLTQRPGVKVTNLDALTYSGNPENLADLEGHPCYRFVKGDICDVAVVERLVNECDAVVHMAAESHVDRSILDAGPFIRANVVGTQVLLDAVRRKDAAKTPTSSTQEVGGTLPTRLVYVSTDEVYGSLPLEDRSKLFTEETPLAPNSPYAASKAASDLLVRSYQQTYGLPAIVTRCSKAAGDCLVRAYHHTFGLDVLATRCSNNFGSYQFPEKVIPLFVTNLIEGQQVPLYGDGRNVRDWLHVEDHCEAVLTVLEQGRAGEVYNIGGNNERSNLELTHAILKAMGKGPEMIRPVKDRPGHDLRYAIDASKINRELGWEPKRSAWPRALEATVKWYVDNPRWWKRVKSGEYRAYYATQYGGR
jgi:dTDP-glucose 4,6-dehydratase